VQLQEMVMNTFLAWLADALLFGALVWMVSDVIRRFGRKRTRRDDSNKEGRIALSDESWLEEMKRMNPKGGKDD